MSRIVSQDRVQMCPRYLFIQDTTGIIPVVEFIICRSFNLLGRSRKINYVATRKREGSCYYPDDTTKCIRRGYSYPLLLSMITSIAVKKNHAQGC